MKIKGIAAHQGSIRSKENKKTAQLTAERYRGNWEKYGQLPDQALTKVTPIEIKYRKYEDTL